jgi:hypothetical protein
MVVKNVLNMLATQVGGQKQEQREAKLYRDLLRHEAQIGGTVFGAVPKDRRREFFCLDEHTWVWHEEWTDESGKHNVMTTRYDVRPSGIVKSQNGSHYQNVSAEEAERLLEAAKLYKQRIHQEIYNKI